jgi:hypothetical protein
MYGTFLPRHHFMRLSLLDGQARYPKLEEEALKDHAIPVYERPSTRKWSWRKGQVVGNFYVCIESRGTSALRRRTCWVGSAGSLMVSRIDSLIAAVLSCGSGCHGILENQRADTLEEALGPTGIQLRNGRLNGLFLDADTKGTEQTFEAIAGGLFGTCLSQAVSVVVENGASVKGDQAQVFVPVESINEVPQTQGNFELLNVALCHGCQVIGECKIVGDDELVLLVGAESGSRVGGCGDDQGGREDL